MQSYQWQKLITKQQPYAAARCFLVGVRENEPTSLTDRLEAWASITNLINRLLNDEKL